MGQKTNANIFRLGVNKKNWELKYIEKSIEESSLYLYKTLEIQKYLNRFFGLYRMKIHNCKVFYSDGSLQIFISFYATTKTIYVINKVNMSKKLMNYRKKLSILSKRLQIRKNSKKNILNSKFLTKQEVVLNEFQEILLESLAVYTKKTVNVIVTLQNLNSYKQLSQTQNKNFKTVFKQLRKFVRNSFFKEAINILFLSMCKRKSAKLLAEFISDQFKLNQLRTDQISLSRKDNHFLGFLKQSIGLLIKSEISCITGMKIIIKGRFNRAPRAKSVLMQFGKFSLQSFDSKIDFFQSTAYTTNGTFGVKIWMCEN
jgi:hypothetical protein